MAVGSLRYPCRFAVPGDTRGSPAVLGSGQVDSMPPSRPSFLLPCSRLSRPLILCRLRRSHRAPGDDEDSLSIHLPEVAPALPAPSAAADTEPAGDTACETAPACPRRCACPLSSLPPSNTADDPPFGISCSAIPFSHALPPCAYPKLTISDILCGRRQHARQVVALPMLLGPPHSSPSLLSGSTWFRRVTAPYTSAG